MNETLEFLVRHGATVLFAAVFVEQMGVPLPAVPWLLAAGALAGAGKMNWAVALSAATFGSLLADLIWFYLGRYRGQRVLNLLCRISLEPDSCVRRTENLFTRYGMPGVVVGEIHSRLEHPGATAGGQCWREYLSIRFLRRIGFIALRRVFYPGGRSVQPPIGAGHQCACRPWATVRSAWSPGWRRFTSASSISNDIGC